MTVTATAGDEVARYLADVAARLDRLDADERAELLADLEQHLLEVAAEEGAPLPERLGPPDAYAAELLASVGFDAVSARRTSVVTRAVDAARRALGTPAGQSTVAYVRTLRPAWWLFRGLVLAWLLADLLDAGALRGTLLLLPEVGSTLVPGLLLTAAGVATSLYVAHRTPPSGTWRWLVVAANVGLFLFALSLAGRVNQRLDAQPVMAYSPPPQGQCLVNGNGMLIENLYAYDSEGRPLDQVLLYDQDGRPIDNLCPSLPTEYARDVNGRTVVNAFPRRQTVHPTSELAPPTPVLPPAIAPPRLATTTTTSTTTTTAPGATGTSPSPG